MKRTIYMMALFILLFLLAGCTADAEFYLVTFDTDGAERIITSQRIMKGKKAVEPRSPEKENMTFSYWTLDGKEYDFSTPVTKDITLCAFYTENRSYTVTFDSLGGSYTPSVQIIKENTTATEPRSPEKENMTFSYWTLDGKEYDFSTPVTKDITLCASYTPLYKVIFYTVGGETVQNEIQYVKEGDFVIEPPAPEYDSKWGFKEWVLVCEDGTTSSFDFKKTRVKSDLIFRATYWEKFSVTYLKADGSTYTTKTVKEGDSAPMLEGPVKDGAWSFSGWLKDGVSYDFESSVTQDITLTPSYIEGYRITFDSDGGSYTPSEQFIKENGTVIEPRSPEKESSRGFMWWTDENGNPYDFSSPVTSSFTLKAQYWPANIISGGDSSSYDHERSSVSDEVLCIDYIIDELVATSALSKGSKEFSEVFGNGDDNKETISGILRAALMQSGEVSIDGKSYSVSELTDYSIITDGCSIDKNSSEISYKDNTADVTRYTIDITGLKIKVKYSLWDEENETYKTTTDSAAIDVRGTLIMISNVRYEEHIKLTVNGNEYPVLHAVSTETGKGSMLFFIYKGLSAYIPETT